MTLLSVVERRDGSLALLCVEAESVSGPILQIGNTNSRYRFPIGARRLIETWNSRGPAHHCAGGTGHLADRLKKLSVLLGIGGKAKQAQLRCYYNMLSRQPEDCAVNALTSRQIAELLNWEAEQYRMHIAK